MIFFLEKYAFLQKIATGLFLFQIIRRIRQYFFKPRILEFLSSSPPYWIRHFEFRKSDNKFVISDHKNL